MPLSPHFRLERLDRADLGSHDFLDLYLTIVKAILLCREEELSYEEIARVLGCSLSATKSLIHRGREALKQKLKPYLRTGVWKGPEK